MKKAAWAVCACVLLWNVYRGAVTPVTEQEAVTYNLFVSQPAVKILTLPYSPANQIAHSFFCRLTVRALRLTEFTLRIPSLFGLALYLWAAFQICPPKTRLRFAVLCVLAANPFTLGWLPQSNGFWMAAALFLIGGRRLMQFRGEPRQLAKASIALGLAGCFYIPFCFAFLAIVLTFLHFEFWGERRLNAWEALNNLVLPAILLLFCVWGLPIVNSTPATWILPSPSQFTLEPAPNLSRVARELRDDLRRSPPRLLRVAASPILINRMDFYRRRYALGAVQKILPLSSPEPTDYSIVFDPELNAAKLVEMHQ